jgi:hypothetical protein
MPILINKESVFFLELIATAARSLASGYLVSFKLIYHYNSIFDHPCCHDISLSSHPLL